jgi:hypothetical protein
MSASKILFHFDNGRALDTKAGAAIRIGFPVKASAGNKLVYIGRTPFIMHFTKE